MMEELGNHPRDALRRVLGLRDAVFLVVASVIGSGIFLTPGPVAALLPDPGWILVAWLAGGLLSLAGALANAELGAMFPRAGGDYVYLREGIHPAAGFMVGWLTFGVIYTGTIAAVSAALAEAIAVPLGWGRGATVALAVAATLLCSALNYVGVRWGALANNVTSIVKLGALTGFALLGLAIGEGDWARLTPPFAGGAGEVTLSAFALAMSPILFSYLGWNATVYVASEVRDPGRNLPRSLFLGLGLCTGFYLLINSVYLYAIPVSELASVQDAGSAAATRLFGAEAAAVVSMFVLVSIFGTLNATVLVGPRIAYAMALDGLFVGAADRVTRSFQTPGVAIVIQAFVACGLLLVLQGFPSALDFTTFAILMAASPTSWRCSLCERVSRIAPARTGPGGTPGRLRCTALCASPSGFPSPWRTRSRAGSRRPSCCLAGRATRPCGDVCPGIDGPTGESRFPQLD